MGCGLAYFNRNLGFFCLVCAHRLSPLLSNDRYFNKPFLIRRYNNATLLEEGGLKGFALLAGNRTVCPTAFGLWHFSHRQVAEAGGERCGEGAQVEDSVIHLVSGHLLNTYCVLGVTLGQGVPQEQNGLGRSS